MLSMLFSYFRGEIRVLYGDDGPALPWAPPEKLIAPHQERLAAQSGVKLTQQCSRAALSRRNFITVR